MIPAPTHPIDSKEETMRQQDTRKDRETAREILTTKIETQRRHLANKDFCTIDPNYLIKDAEWRLRWIDCSPEGARHCVAPMQDKNGIPMGGVFDENIGPCQELRDARIKYGRNPFSGEAVYKR